MRFDARTRLRAAVATGAAAFLALTLSAPASAGVYWTNESAGTISRASGDGTIVDPSFVTGSTAPRGVAIDGDYIYWSHDDDPMPTGSIGRAALDGSAPNQSFIPTTGPPSGLVVDSSSIYWTQTVSSSGKIGRATLAGVVLNQSFVTTASPSPCGISSDADEVYWANAGTPGSVGSAHGMFNVNQSLISNTADPCGVARAGDFVYWTNRATDSIGRANLDGSDPQPSFIPLSAGATPCGVAVDGDYIYWTSADDMIGRAPAGGLGHDVEPQEDFITTGVLGPCGIAVSPTIEVTPPGAAFADTVVGAQSDIQAFLVSNTSSSVLDVTAIDISGANPNDFELTGEGCSVKGVAAGLGCFVNVRFTPTATGDRSATLTLGSNASGPPSEMTLTGKGADAGGEPAPSRDTTAPSFLSASIRPAKFVASSGASGRGASAAAPQRPTFSFSLSEAAAVVFTINRKSKGSVVRGECVAERPLRSAGPPCTRLVPAGSFADPGETGQNEKGFPAGIVRRLHPSRYRASLVATDAANNISSPVQVRFRVLPQG